MANWGFWDWMAYGTLALSAFILAVIQWRKDMTVPSWIPRFFLKIPWSYLPLILLILATFIFISTEKGWIGSSKKHTQAQISQQEWNKIPMVAINNKTYAQEVVPLDGHTYGYCKFIGVTLLYNGNAPFDIHHSNFEGLTLIRSDKPQIEQLLKALVALHFMRPDLIIIPQGE